MENYQGESYQHLTLFQEVPYESVKDILESCPVQTLEPDQLLLALGQENRFFFQVISGNLTVHLREIDTPAIARIEQGSCVGELSIIDEKHATAFVRATEFTHLLVIDTKSLWELIAVSQRFVYNLLVLFTSRMRHRTDALVESQLVCTIPDIIYRLDKDGRFIFLNESVEKLGFTAEELAGCHFRELVAEDELEQASYANAIKRIRKSDQIPEEPPKLFDERRSDHRKTTGLEVKLRLKYKRISGPERSEIVPDDMFLADVSCTGIKETPPDGKEGKYLGTIGVIRDITERKMYQAQLAEQKARTDSILTAMGDAIVVINSSGAIERINHATITVFGYTEEELIGKNVSMLMPSPNRENHDGYLQSYLESGHKKVLDRRVEVIACRKNGTEFDIDLSVTEVRLDKRILFTAVIRDITERKRAEHIIHYQANYDALTDLPNRSMFMENLEKSIRQSNKDESEMALLFVDLDRFKWINDNLGHSAGDELLKASAKRIESCIKSGDTVARLGGDEFTVILENIQDIDQVAGIAKRILQTLNQSFKLEEQDVYISGSMGIAIFPQDASDLETLLKRADEAMYQSKNVGKNAYHFFTGQSLRLKNNY